MKLDILLDVQRGFQGGKGPGRRPGLSETTRRQCCRAECSKAAEATSLSHRKQDSSPVYGPHHLTLHDLLCQPDGTFLVEQVLMKEVKRIMEVRQESSETSMSKEQFRGG